MKGKFSLIIVCLCTIQALFAQEDENQPEFKISGSPVITIFANYHAGLGEHNHLSGFSLTRAYLGYQFKLSETLSGKAVVDAGISPEESVLKTMQRDVILKNAFLSWKHNGFIINGGLISTLEFDIQEKFWGRRYIAPSYQDLYKMGPSADMGISIACQMSSGISADVSFTNGEGYKHLNADNKYRYGLGITAKPVQGLTFRVYGDIRQKNDTGTVFQKNQQTIAIFSGYAHNRFSIGAEYNYQANKAFVDKNDYYGYSIYADAPVSKKWSIFARYDRVDSKNNNSRAWFLEARDLVIGGIEFKPIKQLRIAPNYKYIFSDKTGPLHELYVNVGFNW